MFLLVYGLCKNVTLTKKLGIQATIPTLLIQLIHNDYIRLASSKTRNVYSKYPAE
jgi:hypothetical protein